MSSEADRALGRAQGGNNSQGPIYKWQVTGTHNPEAFCCELGQYGAYQGPPHCRSLLSCDCGKGLICPYSLSTARVDNRQEGDCCYGLLWDAQTA